MSRKTIRVPKLVLDCTRRRPPAWQGDPQFETKSDISNHIVAEKEVAPTRTDG